jgi:hypothetical protein
MWSHKYRSLSCAKSIRLFIFLPSQSRRNSVIKVDLIETTLPEHPPYDALSYTWGDLLEKVAIDIDGSSLDVTPNFHTFLGYLQQEVVASNKPRYFWADQICINQNDMEERKQQVALMGEIYLSCQKTIIWLGEEDSNSKIFCQALRVIELLDLHQEVKLTTISLNQITESLYRHFRQREGKSGKRIYRLL